MIVTTTNDVTGYRVVQHLGVVRGITVRSRSVIGNIGAGIQSLFGGNITIYTSLAEKAREEAFELMVQHAASGRRQRRARHALRRQRDQRRHHRGAGLRHGGEGGARLSGFRGERLASGPALMQNAKRLQECSSMARAPVSKTGGCRFESCHSCQ